MQTGKPIEINLTQVLGEKLGTRSRFVPRFVVRALENIIHQDELNELLRNNFPLRGGRFCEGIIDDLEVELEVKGAENLPDDPRFIMVSNHPLGGLDGITMIAWLNRRYGRTAHFVVNDLLMAIEPLRDCFLPVNKHGVQSKDSLRKLNEALAGPDPVVIYPAGLVSRLGDDGTIADLEWHKMFVQKAVEYRRPVVPVYFEAHNSRSFYRLARLRKRMGLKFNAEMILLPREVFRSKGAKFTLTVGRPAHWQELEAGGNPTETAARMRNLVYSLANINKSNE